VLHRLSNCSPSRAMDGRIMHHGIISSCQSAATSEIVKRCCSSLVSSAIASTQTFTFTFTVSRWVFPVSGANIWNDVPSGLGSFDERRGGEKGMGRGLANSQLWLSESFTRKIFENIGANLCNTVHLGVKIRILYNSVFNLDFWR